MRVEYGRESGSREPREERVDREGASPGDNGCEWTGVVDIFAELEAFADCYAMVNGQRSTFANG